MSRLLRLTSLLFVFAAVGCAGPRPAQPTADVPDQLRPGANESLAMIVPAEGVQIYECSKKGGAGEYEWAFVAPEADLFDARGGRIGLHYAGPHWEAADGSKLAGRVKARADAPVADAIPWLLLEAESVGAEGSFSRITSIQRVNTAGGVAPGGECSTAEAGERARIPYTANYYFFAPE